MSFHTKVGLKKKKKKDKKMNRAHKESRRPNTGKYNIKWQKNAKRTK